MQGKTVVISAPSGAGKTSIVNFLIDQVSSLEFSISACSREKRLEETDGVNYHFMSSPQFQEMIAIIPLSS